MGLEIAARVREFVRVALVGSRAGGRASAFDADFDRLACELFAFQFEFNAPYRALCQSRKVSLDSVSAWGEIPAVPTSAFKELELTCLSPEDRTAVFHSSGTTGQRPSRNFHSKQSLALYGASLLTWFNACVGGEVDSEAGQGKLRPNAPGLISLTPPADEVPHSSLAHMFEAIRFNQNAPGRVFYGKVLEDGGWGIDVAELIDALNGMVTANQPVLLLGTAFSFVHLLDGLNEQNLMFCLPRGSRVMETGGYKGRSRVLPREELHAMIAESLGVPVASIFTEYGMSELSSQAYRFNGGVVQFPPWARARIISPENGKLVAEGETGLVQIMDLANVFSVMAIQTEDLGVRRGAGFDLLGRAVEAEPRGCSLMAT
jgi:hypothetical protein